MNPMVLIGAFVLSLPFYGAGYMIGVQFNLSFVETIMAVSGLVFLPFLAEKVFISSFNRKVDEFIAADHGGIFGVFLIFSTCLTYLFLKSNPPVGPEHLGAGNLETRDLFYDISLFGYAVFLQPLLLITVSTVASCLGLFDNIRAKYVSDLQAKIDKPQTPRTVFLPNAEAAQESQAFAYDPQRFGAGWTPSPPAAAPIEIAPYVNPRLKTLPDGRKVIKLDNGMVIDYDDLIGKEPPKRPILTRLFGS